MARATSHAPTGTERSQPYRRGLQKGWSPNERFARIKSGYEQDIRFLHSYAERKPGTAPAKTSVKNAFTVKRSMARALNRHVDRCLQCG
ncbi:hypothetical protein ACH4UT_34185, partial [Streptomyces sp. NPDC020799]|uniref:hypothetical protein n=1 Tax=Streptomyces sp. NPDC020799 TaxID=3365091 RepID=UPI00379F8376